MCAKGAPTELPDGRTVLMFKELMHGHAPLPWHIRHPHWATLLYWAALMSAAMLFWLLVNA